MGKQSPKHIQRRKLMQKQMASQKPTVGKKVIVYSIIGMITIVSTIMIIIYRDQIFTPNTGEDTIVVEDGDEVQVEYKFWTKRPTGGFDHTLTPEKDGTFTFTAEFPLTVAPCGLYFEVLGHSENYTKYFRVGPNIDSNNDYIDDDTGEQITGYISGEYAGEELLFWIKIISITKAA